MGILAFKFLLLNKEKGKLKSGNYCKNKKKLFLIYAC